MNRIAKAGDVAHWHRYPPLSESLMAVLRSEGFRTKHLVDMNGGNPSAANITRDEHRIRLARRFGGGDLRLLDLGFGPEIDPFHGLNVQPFFDKFGISNPTPEEVVYAAYVYGAQMVAHLPSGGPMSNTPGSSPTNPWTRSSRPREQSMYEFVYFKNATKPWQRWPGGVPGTKSPEWIAAAGGDGEVIPPPTSPTEPPTSPTGPTTPPPITPPVTPPAPDREQQISEAINELESILESSLLDTKRRVKQILDRRWPM